MPHIQHIDGLPVRLREEYDFGFLGRFGRVFRVYDDQDSGNICFGAGEGSERCFIKFAGAPTVNYDGSASDAIERLRSAEPVWRELKHPRLIDFIAAEELGGGYALIFRWADAVSMGRMYPEQRRKFMSLSADERLGVYADLQDFLRCAHESGWAAVDFYDGSVMYDFKARRTVICDIDFFRRLPAVNDMGRMWGSSRFMSPEEFTLGAPIDEITNVYTLGAFAFALFSDYDRSPRAWTLGEAAYRTALRAVSDDRKLRWQSIGEFIAEWRVALRKR